MAISVPVPKDLSCIKTKVALNLTKRQLICFSLAAIVGVSLYFSTKKVLGTQGAMFLMVGAMPPQTDELMEIREEYEQILKHQRAKGNNGVLKSKYLLFGVESTGYKEARNKLNNIEKDVIHNLHNIGTNARTLNGKERLHILYEYFNQGTMEPFRFSF